MRLLDRRYLTDSVAAMVGFLAIVAPIATWVAVTDTQQARHALGYGFAHVPRAPDQALSIFTNNVWILLVPLAMTLIVQARFEVERRTRRRAYVALCDLVALTPVLINALTIGMSLGAYGWRMVLSMLPAGPVELTAFALAASVYMRSRRAAITRGAIAGVAGTATLSLALLLAAALLETYA
jgi:hypothetical protein